jgi:hypothetical protein
MPALIHRFGIVGGTTMRIGSLASPKNLVAALLTLAAGTILSPVAIIGQSRYGDGGPGAPGATQALYVAPSQGPMAVPSPYVDAYGNQMIVPAGFSQSCGQGGSCPQCGGYGVCDGGGCGGGRCGDGGCGEGGCGGGGYGGCSGCSGGPCGPCPMGAGGTDPPVGYDLMNDAGIQGDLVDQRGPHNWDVRAEAVVMSRDKTFDESIAFTAQNVGGPVVLSSNQLDFGSDNWGFRVMGRYDVCPLSVIEVGYMGIFDFQASASVSDPTNNLFSLFSRPAPGTGIFGISPVGVNLPGGPNPFTERASFQSIDLESNLQSAEVSYRRYWLGYWPRVSGTLLAGARYVKIGEDFEFFSQGSEVLPQPQPQNVLASLRYDVNTDNNLAGAQAGGDVWVSLMQGLRIGTEGKAGVYNNNSKLTNRIVTSPVGVQPPSLFEQFRENNIAFVGEASVDVVADLFPSLSLRAGYEVLFVDSLILAGDNFNQVSPYGNQGTRQPFVDDHGELFYHGAHFGVEYIW